MQHYTASRGQDGKTSCLLLMAF